MSVVAAKAGVGFVVILAILGVVQPHLITEPLLLFVTVGLIPGTSYEVAPEVSLLAAGTVLVVLAGLFFRRFTSNAALDADTPEYVRGGRQGRGHRSSFPGSARSVAAVANGASVELYFWLMSFGHRSISRAAGPNPRPPRLKPDSNFAKIGGLGRVFASRTKYYLIRLTIL